MPLSLLSIISRIYIFEVARQSQDADGCAPGEREEENERRGEYVIHKMQKFGGNKIMMYG
jgi:hypothetical protein